MGVKQKGPDTGVDRVASVIRSSDSRRLPVLAAAAELVLEVGVEGATSRGIADRAGTSVASMYRIFPDKQAVLTATLQAQLTELAGWQRERLAGEEPDATSLFSALFDGYVAWCAHRPDYRALWFTGEGGAGLHEVRWRSTRRLIDICAAKLADVPAIRTRATVLVTASDRVVGASYRYPANRRKIVQAGRSSLMRYLEAGVSSSSR